MLKVALERAKPQVPNPPPPTCQTANSPPSPDRAPFHAPKDRDPATTHTFPPKECPAQAAAQERGQARARRETETDKPDKTKAKANAQADAAARLAPGVEPAREPPAPTRA